MLPYQDTIKKKIGLAGKAGALCKTVSLVCVCHFTAMLLLKPDFPQSRWLEQVSASALRIFSCFTIMPLKGNPPFFCPSPSPKFASTQAISNLTPLNREGKKNPELSRALLGLCFSNSLYQYVDSETFWKASL